MSEETATLPPRLREIVEDFAWSEGRDKLQLLLDYSDRLPPLPIWLAQRRGAMEPVSECMTPVAVHAETRNGTITFHFDVPPESPTVRGYAAILTEGLRGLSPEEVLAVPNTFFRDMGLDAVLTHQRLAGMVAMLVHVKRLAAQALEAR